MNSAIMLQILILGVVLFGCSRSRDSIQGQKPEDMAPNLGKASQEAQNRKARSTAILKAEGVPINESLPVIADSATTKWRSAEEIAKRAIAICLTAVKGEGMDQTNLNEMVDFYGATPFFSPQEAAFIKSPTPSFKDRAMFTWRHEDYYVLLWALGYVDDLGRPDHQCDVMKTAGFLKNRNTEEFIQDAKLRNISVILDQTDLIYRYHWAVVDARLKGRNPPANLSEDVLMEWHYVLNWLIGYMDQDWASVTIDMPQTLSLM